MIRPTEHRCRVPADFVGPARQVATQLQSVCARARAAGFAPIKLFFTGPSGTGKSELTHYVTDLLGVSRWGVTCLNGTDVTIDRLRELEHALHLTVNELFGDYRVIQIHEADRITSAAQVKMLSLLDDLPPRTALVCSTNHRLKEMEERFQRRFKAWEVGAAEPFEITEFIVRRFGLPHHVADAIATQSGGNVALAFIEAESWLDDQPAPAGAAA